MNEIAKRKLTQQDKQLRKQCFIEQAKTLQSEGKTIAEIASTLKLTDSRVRTLLK